MLWEVSLSDLFEEPVMIKEEVSPYMNPKMIPVITLEKFVTLKRSDNLREKADYLEPSL